MPKVVKIDPENRAPDGLPYHGFVRLPQILAILPVCRSTFLSWVKDGKFPPPVKLGHRCAAWRVEDVRELLAQFEAATQMDSNCKKAMQVRMAKRTAEAEKAARRALLI